MVIQLASHEPWELSPGGEMKTRVGKRMTFLVTFTSSGNYPSKSGSNPGWGPHLIRGLESYDFGHSRTSLAHLFTNLTNKHINQYKFLSAYYMPSTEVNIFTHIISLNPHILSLNKFC